MGKKTIYARDLMQRWNMNDIDFVNYVAEHLPGYGASPPFLFPYENHGMLQADRFRFEDPAERPNTRKHLDNVFFYVSDIEPFEAAHPELLKKATETVPDATTKRGRTTLSEKERALLTFAKEKLKKTPDLSVPFIVGRFIRSDRDIMYDKNGNVKRGYKQGTLEKDLRRLLNSH